MAYLMNAISPYSDSTGAYHFRRSDEGSIPTYVSGSSHMLRGAGAAGLTVEGLVVLWRADGDRIAGPD